MEKKLKKLFDYQRFEQNGKLEKLIRDTESRYATELSDDELGMVNAAGEFTVSGGTISGNKSGSVGSSDPMDDGTDVEQYSTWEVLPSRH